MMDSEKFVLASESKLSLATGLASWKVSLKPWYRTNSKHFLYYSYMYAFYWLLVKKLSNTDGGHLLWNLYMKTVGDLSRGVLYCRMFWPNTYHDTISRRSGKEPALEEGRPG